MLEKIFEFFFDGVVGKVVLAGAMLASLVGWFAYDQRNIGARNAIAEVNQSAAGLARDAEAERALANRPGAIERLRQHSCRDC